MSQWRQTFRFLALGKSSLYHGANLTPVRYHRHEGRAGDLPRVGSLVVLVPFPSKPRFCNAPISLAFESPSALTYSLVYISFVIWRFTSNKVSNSKYSQQCVPNITCLVPGYRASNSWLPSKRTPSSHLMAHVDSGLAIVFEASHGERHARSSCEGTGEQTAYCDESTPVRPKAWQRLDRGSCPPFRASDLKHLTSWARCWSVPART